MPATPFTIAFAAGVTLTRWTTAWQERYRWVPLEFVPTDSNGQVSVLHDGEADVSFVRLPVDEEGLHVIPLYSEQPVVVLPKEHDLAEAESLLLADLSEWEYPIPQSIARQTARKDEVAVPVTDAAQTRIALAWRADNDRPEIEDWVGIVRGRTANSSRATPSAPELKKARPKSPPKKKTPQNQPKKKQPSKRKPR